MAKAGGAEDFLGFGGLNGLDPSPYDSSFQGHENLVLLQEAQLSHSNDGPASLQNLAASTGG